MIGGGSGGDGWDFIPKKKLSGQSPLGLVGVWLWLLVTRRRLFNPLHLAFLAWTNPANWGNGTLVTETDLNVQIRDNLIYLFSRPAFWIKRTQGSNYSAAGASWADVDATNLKGIITVSGTGTRTVLVGLLCGIEATAGQIVYLDIDVDGTRWINQQYGLRRFVGSLAGAPVDQDFQVFCFVVPITGLSAGAHTFKVKWSTGTTGYMAAMTTNYPVIFWGIEVA